MSEEIELELTQLDNQLRLLAKKMRGLLMMTFNPNDVLDLMTSDAVIDICVGTRRDDVCLIAGETLVAYKLISKAKGGRDDDNEDNDIDGSKL